MIQVTRFNSLQGSSAWLLRSPRKETHSPWHIAMVNACGRATTWYLSMGSAYKPSSLGWPMLNCSCFCLLRIQGDKSFEIYIQVVVSNMFYFQPYLGKWSNLTHIFQMGWKHQLVHVCLEIWFRSIIFYTYTIFLIVLSGYYFYGSISQRKYHLSKHCFVGICICEMYQVCSVYVVFCFSESLRLLTYHFTRQYS